MSTLLFGLNRAPVTPNEKEVRSTVTVVENDAPTATADRAPDFNDVITDADTQGGLTTHQVSSHVIPSERYLPGHAPTAHATHMESVNDRISSVGTAAEREARGEWGHGSLKVTEGIEPVLRDGADFGELYFKADERGANPTASLSMTPVDNMDDATAAAIVAGYQQNSRQAASPDYAAFHNAMTGL